MYLHDQFLLEMAVITRTSEDVYATWEAQLQDDLWHQVQAVYADSVQVSVLRALAIDGVATNMWSTVFSQLVSEDSEWSLISHSWFEQGKIPDLDWFTRTIAGSVSYRPWRVNMSAQPWPTHYQAGPQYDCCLPPIFPLWLWNYGYTQLHYIQDLKRYWSDIDPEYYQPWPGTLIGDISSITTVKKLGAQARQEIGTLFDLAGKHVESLQANVNAER